MNQHIFYVYLYLYLHILGWRNLLKTSDMEVGAISYHDRSKVKRVKVEKNTELIKTLNKTKIESYPDLAALQLVRAREFQQEQKEQKRSQMQQEKESRRLQQEQARQRSYADVMISENMQSNKEMSSSVDTSAAKEYEDDFM